MTGNGFVTRSPYKLTCYRDNMTGNLFCYTPHCKKTWRSSSTPASGDAGPIHTGIEKSFRHPCRKFYYKYRTFSTDFYKCRTSSTLGWKVSKAALPGRELRFSDLQSDTLPLRHTSICQCSYLLVLSKTGTSLLAIRCVLTELSVAVINH